MEAKLAAYRARKIKEKQAPDRCNDEEPRLARSEDDSSVEQLEEPCTQQVEEVIPRSEQTASSKAALFTLPRCLVESRLGDFLAHKESLLTKPLFLKVALWVILWGLFVEIGFGAVYFVISLLCIIYASMRPGSKQSGELSAYSVFNPNFEQLEGTFTAEQFERELRYGAGSVR